MDNINKKKISFKLGFLTFLLLFLLQIFLFSFIQTYLQNLAGWQFDQSGMIISYGNTWGIWVGLIITEVLIGSIVIMIFYYQDISIKDFFTKSKLNVTYILIGVPTAFIVGYGASFIQFLVMELFQIQYPQSINVLTAILTPKNVFELIMWILIMFFIVAPCEELFARGCIQKGFQNSFEDRENGHYLAIIGSSICFMIFHIDPFRFFPIFCESLIIGYIFYKTDSLSTVILIHAFLNTLLITFSVFGM